jgi:hypothetical protein
VFWPVKQTVLSKFCGELYSFLFERSTIMSRMLQLWGDSSFLESIKKGTQAKAAGADSAGADSAGSAGGASSSAQADAAPVKTMEDYMQGPPMLAARRGGLKKVFVEPSELFLEAGGTHYGFTAVALYGDGSRLNIPNDSVTWDTSKNDVAHIDKTGGVVTEFAGVAILSATHLGVTGKATVTVREPRLFELKISPENPTKVGGGNVNFSIMGIYENVTGPKEYKKAPLPKDVKVEWKSSAPQVVAIDQTGHAIVKNIGTANISATANGVSATTPFKVVPPGAGAQKIRVEITVLDANHVGINGKGIAVFRHGNCQDVEVEAAIRGGYFYVEPTIMADGNMEFRATDGRVVTASSSAPYHPLSHGKMEFTAIQRGEPGKDTIEDQGEKKSGDKKSRKIGDKTSDKTTDKTSHKKTDKAKGGLDIEVIKIEGGVDTEDGTEKTDEHGTEHSVEDTDEHSEEDTTRRRHQVEKGSTLGTEGFDLKQDK